MNRKFNNAIISFAMALMLVSGAMLTSGSTYAEESEKSNSSEKSEKSKGSEKSEKSNTSDSTHSPDSNARGNSSEVKKIIICHVPKGNPANKHTIHIGFSAWPAHRDNHGGDYLGSCNNPPSTPTSPTTKTAENLVVIKDCSGEYRKTLVELTQSYFDPVIVNDDALDDEDMVTALSQCLDKGDSSDSSKSDSDSGKNKPDSGKGGGHDSVSDSGKHHRISGCKNRDSSDSHKDSGDSKEADSSKNYHKKLTQRKKSFDSTHSHGDSSLNISDSSMDDSDVYKEYKKCADSNKAKGDSGKGDSGKGDSGHKYRIMNNCSNAQAIKAAIKTHKEKVADDDSSNKYLKRPVIIKTSSLTDTRIKTAVDACLDPKKGGGTQETLPPSDPTGHTGYNGRLNWREITNP